MATKSPPPPPPSQLQQEEEQQQQPPLPSAEQQQQQQLESSPNPTTTPTVTPDIPPLTTAPKETPTPPSTTITSRPPEQSPADAEVIHVPSYSRWFSWNNIHDCEVRFLPEFFDERSPSKNPKLYKYYRNSIIRRFRENPTRKIAFTEARKTIVGDVGSVRRVFDFLEAWGLINYLASASKQQLKWEDKDSKSNTAATSSSSHAAESAAATSAELTLPKKRICSGCKSVCTIACFACDKYELTLCARCYVRGNYRVGVNSSDFRRVEINEEIKTDWNDKDTLRLLEAILHHGDNWKKVAEHVGGGRSERECVARFIKLPVAEQFLGPSDSVDFDDKYFQTKVQAEAESRMGNSGTSSPSKRLRLTPLADASNPIMAQAAFLSAVVGVEVAEAAAGAAIRALSDIELRTTDERSGPVPGGAGQRESDVAQHSDCNLNTTEGADRDARSQLEKEEHELERAIASIAEVQTMEIQEKIVHFEEFELQMEKEWQQVHQMKEMLFVDQLTLLFHKNAAPKTGENMEEL